jgi:hypothetical protein
LDLIAALTPHPVTDLADDQANGTAIASCTAAGGTGSNHVRESAKRHTE